jgi:hypothetical protein
MTLPNFLCIGAQKCGTSWLDSQLRNHPRIYVPTQRKELHFFDQYFERGLQWYEGHFPSDGASRDFDAIGEVTPRYILEPEIPARIRQTLPQCRLIALLRNPADRLFSQYLMAVNEGQKVGSVQEYAEKHPSAFIRGLYDRQLERYFEYFPREDVHILIYEEVFADTECTRAALASIARFLGTDPEGFPHEGELKRVNAGGGVPRSAFVSRAVHRFRRYLRDHDMDWVVHLASRAGLSRRMLSGGRPPPSLREADRIALMQQYEASIGRLESLIGHSLNCWRTDSQGTGHQQAAGIDR